jgi:hypothetical protein
MASLMRRRRMSERAKESGRFPGWPATVSYSRRWIESFPRAGRTNPYAICGGRRPGFGETRFDGGDIPIANRSFHLVNVPKIWPCLKIVLFPVCSDI